MTHVLLKKVSKFYEGHQVLFDVNLDINDREFIVFVGPSGCGKSTLLRSIAGLEDIQAGELHIDGVRVEQLPPAERGISMVFQSYALYPHMNVYNNMAFGLKLAKFSKDEIKSRVLRAAKILQIDHLLERKPKDMSGGQRQRVAIGRAIVREPKVFLFDEPLSNLDAKLRVQMRLELIKLHKSLKATMIYVTHDQVEAMTMADRIVVMQAGRIEQVGTPVELYHKPKNIFVAGFIGSPSMNFMKVEVLKAGLKSAHISLGADQAELSIQTTVPCEDHELTLGIRPEHVQISSMKEAHLDGVISVIEHLGSHRYIYLNVGNEQIIVQDSGTETYQLGQTLGMKFDLNHIHLFDRHGLSLIHI